MPKPTRATAVPAAAAPASAAPPAVTADAPDPATTVVSATTAPVVPAVVVAAGPPMMDTGPMGATAYANAVPDCEPPCKHNDQSNARTRAVSAEAVRAGREDRAATAGGGCVEVTFRSSLPG